MLVTHRRNNRQILRGVAAATAWYWKNNQCLMPKKKTITFKELLIQSKVPLPEKKNNIARCMKERNLHEGNTTIMEDFIPTRCARVNKSVEQNFVSIEYTAHKKKVVENFKPERSLEEYRKEDRGESVDPTRQHQLEMKRARYDVIKFGMSGFGNVEVNRAKVAAAVALGARPPKNRKTHYKKLKEERSRANEAIKKKERISGANKSLVKLRVRKKKDNKKESGILGVYGKVKRGTLKS